MPECVCCGDTEFDLVDGMYYCSTCQTQTQDIRDEQVGEDFAGHDSIFVRKEKSGRVEKHTVVDKGRPWETFEGFQIIIQEQVKSLIKLGAKPELEDLVFRLWALYLSKTGKAFTDKSDTKNTPIKYARQRDKYHGTIEDPEVIAVRYRKTYKKNHMESIQKINMPSFSDVKFYEGDDPTELFSDECKSSSTIESSSDSENGNQNGLPKKTKIKKKRKVLSMSTIRDQPGWMKMIRTICFCYLGLIYTNSFATPADIVRWIRNGKIPYNNPTSLLPDDMKIGPHDRNTFWAEIPSTDFLREETGRLAYFLGIREYPMFPVRELISRYILQLELPAEMHGFVARLVNQQSLEVKYKLHKSRKLVPHYEAIAVAYVILLLKLLFGLDDHTERQLSEYAKELMQLIGGNHHLFVWDDWMMHVGRKFAELQTTSFIFGRSDIRDITNVDIFLEHYRLLSHKQGKFSRKRNRNKNFQRQTREDIQKPFCSLLQNWKDQSPSKKAPAHVLTGIEESYDPSSVATMFDEDPVGFLLGHDEDNTQTKLKENHPFRYSTIKYITRPETFLDDLDKQGLSDFTIDSSRRSSSSSSEDSDDLLMDDYGSPNDCKKQNKKTLSASETVVRHAVSKKIPQTPSKKQIQNESKFDEVMKKLLRAHENYIVYKSPNCERHRSYQWLLSVCSNFIDCNPEQLDEEVKKLQMVYFLDKQDLNSYEVVSLRFLLNKYFGGGSVD